MFNLLCWLTYMCMYIHYVYVCIHVYSYIHVLVFSKNSKQFKNVECCRWNKRLKKFLEQFSFKMSFLHKQFLLFFVHFNDIFKVRMYNFKFF